MSNSKRRPLRPTLLLVLVFLLAATAETALLLFLLG
jgi:hypothetical protein